MDNAVRHTPDQGLLEIRITGDGSGLAIVKELVAAHGGAVGAEPLEGRLCIWFSPPPAGANADGRERNAQFVTDAGKK